MKVNDKICQSCTAAKGRDTSQSVLRLEAPPAVGREQMGFTGVRLLKGRLQDGNGGGGAGGPPENGPKVDGTAAARSLPPPSPRCHAPHSVTASPFWAPCLPLLGKSRRTAKVSPTPVWASRHSSPLPETNQTINQLINAFILPMTLNSALPMCQALFQKENRNF